MKLSSSSPLSLGIPRKKKRKSSRQIFPKKALYRLGRRARRAVVNTFRNWLIWKPEKQKGR